MTDISVVLLHREKKHEKKRRDCCCAWLPLPPTAGSITLTVVCSRLHHTLVSAVRWIPQPLGATDLLMTFPANRLAHFFHVCTQRKWCSVQRVKFRTDSIEFSSSPWEESEKNKAELRKETMFTTTYMIPPKYKVDKGIRKKKCAVTHLYPQVKLDLEWLFQFEFHEDSQWQDAEHDPHRHK